MAIVIWIVVLAAFGLGGAMVLAGPGTGMGFWEFPTAFAIFRTLAMPTLIATVLAFLAAVFAFFTSRRSLALIALLASVVAGIGGYIPIKMRSLVEANPFIHDVTTDFENPPQIIAAAELTRSNPPNYVGDEQVRDTGKTVAQAQMEAFPELMPLILSEGVEPATARTRTALKEMGLEILADGPVSESDGSAWRIEAVATSKFFRFKDDFIVRLSSISENETQVDVRSKSRVGGSDLGANAARVREFMDLMKQQ